MTDITYTIDTNVLVYAHDPRDEAKQDRALTCLGELGRRGLAVMPTQVLSEFANVALRKLGLEPSKVGTQIADLSAAYPSLPLTPTVVAEAVRAVREHQLSYFDAQIWAASRMAGVSAVLSEDFENGRTVEGVTFVDPFALEDPSTLWGDPDEEPGD